MARTSRREYWQEVLARQASSGLSVKTFCVRERVSYQSYFLWKRKLRKEPVEAKGEVTFAPVSVVGQAPTEAGGMEIVLPGDRRVIVHAPVDRQALTDVLAVLDGTALGKKPC
jgi:hypothetical protein